MSQLAYRLAVSMQSQEILHIEAVDQWDIDLITDAGTGSTIPAYEAITID